MADGYRYPGGLTDADFADGLTATGYSPHTFSYGSKINIDVAGTVTKLGLRCQPASGTPTIKINLFDSSGNLVTGSGTFTNSGALAWKDCTETLSISVTSGDYYVFVSSSDTNSQYGYDNSGNGCGESVAYASFPPASLSVTEDESGTRFGVRLYLEEAVSQFAYPTTDTTRDNWEEDDGTTTAIYDQIDEVTADDADYIRTQANPSSDVYVTKFGSLTDPVSSTLHSVNLRYGKDSASGDTISLLAQLRQGYTNEGSPGTLIATVLNNSDIGSGWTQVDYSLSGTEADSITNYGDLYLRLVGNKEADGTTAPTYRGAGGTGVQSGSTSMTVTAVTSNAENDVLLIVMESSDSSTAAGTPTTPTDWTKVFERTEGDGATNVTTLTIFARLAPTGGSGDVTVSGVGNHCAGRMFAVTVGTHGVTNVATDILVGAGTGHGTSTTNVVTGELSGLTANSLIFWCIGLSDDAADTTNASGYTNSNFASITERTDQTVSTGAGGGIAVATATCAGTTTGSTGNWDHDTAVNSQSVYLAIPPAATPRRAQVSWARFQTPEATAAANEGTGVSAGTSTATAGATAEALTSGTAAGTSTATAGGLSEIQATGNAAGTSTATATAYTQTSATGVAAGTGAGQATAYAEALTTGNAAGTGDAQGSGDFTAPAAVEATGTAAGTSTANATAVAEALTAGASAGIGTANAAAVAEAAMSGVSAGTGTAAATAYAEAKATGTAAGIADAQGSGHYTTLAAETTGNAAGTSTATATAYAEVYATGNAEGTSDAQGVSFIEIPASVVAQVKGGIHRRKVPRYILAEDEEEEVIPAQPAAPFKQKEIIVRLPKLTSFQASIEPEYVKVVEPGRIRVKSIPPEMDDEDEWLLMS